MRLGQLSRKLDVDSEAIVKLIEKNFREVNNHPNIKITEEELEFVTNHFAPAKPKVEEPKELETAPIAEVESTPSEEIVREQTTPEKPAFVESLRPKVITLEEEFNEKKKELETFKAEKPELEGLKVVGKIDLPEPKPKAPKEPKEEKTPNGTQTINERGVKQRNYKKGNRQNNNRNPVEAARKRAENQTKREKEAHLKKLKEQKKKHYEETVKAKIADKPKKKKKKKFVEQQAVQSTQQSSKHLAPKSSNPIVRFWKWLKGDYDKFN